MPRGSCGAPLSRATQTRRVLPLATRPRSVCLPYVLLWRTRIGTLMAWYRRGDHDFVLSYSSLPALATLRERVCIPSHGMECICWESRSHSSGGASPQGQQSAHSAAGLRVAFEESPPGLSLRLCAAR